MATTRMQQRRGTSSEWTSANPVLAAGEIGFETDTNKFKIGDGINNWGSLDYFSTSIDLSSYATESYVDNSIASVIDSAPEALDTLNELSAALNDDANAFTTLSNQITSGDSASLATAQAYADTQDAALSTQLTSDFQSYTDSETSDKATFDYVDAADVATLTTANAYTDTQLSNVEPTFTNNFMLMGA